MNTADRVKLLLNKIGMTQKKFAHSIGISPARLNNYFASRSRISQAILVEIASVYNVNLTWLLTGTGSMFNNVPAHVEHAAPADLSPVQSDRSAFYSLPVIPDIAAGPAIDVTNAEPLATLRLPRSFLPLSPPYYCFRVSGTSMIPTVQPADLVIVSASYLDIDLDNRLCAFRTADGIILKRLALDHSTRSGFLLSDNPAIRPLHYTADTPDLTLVGVVVALYRTFIDPTVK